MSEISDILERFRRGPEVVSGALKGATEEQMDLRPAPEKWTAREIAAHLADSEIEAAVRFRRIVAEDNPAIQGYNQDTWARKLHYDKRDVAHSVELFRVLRQENFEVLKDLPDDAFERTAQHSERGQMTLREWLTIYARHAEKHADQILAATGKANNAQSK